MTNRSRKLRVFVSVVLYFAALGAVAALSGWVDANDTDRKVLLFRQAAMHQQLDSLMHRTDSLERVVLAQEQFFDRFLVGHFHYLPALEACRSSFRGYVALNAAHTPRYQLFWTPQQIDSALHACQQARPRNLTIKP